MTIRELKTGKMRRIRVPMSLLARALSSAGKAYVFEGRLDWRKPRSKQALWKDLKRVARIFRLKPNIAPHSARKVWAVNEYRRTGDLKRIQRLLNHSSEGVTMLYALADQLTAKHRRPSSK